ncbi:MAG TPA: oligosaccharide flippase family protein [Mycobacteriales bacterium]|nr:oligosaccharide flippase family protein [Mycobacteriales bacterium]
MNTTILTSARLTSVLVAGACVVLLTHHVGASEFGVYVIGITAVSIASSLVDGGLLAASIRISSREEVPLGELTRALFAARLGLALALGLPMCGILFVALPSFVGAQWFVVGCGAQVVAAAAVGAGQLPAQLGAGLRRWAMADLIGRTMGSSGLILLALFAPGRAVAYSTLLMATGTAISWLTLWILPRTYVDGKWFRSPPSRALIIRLFRDSTSLGVALVINTLYFRLDTLLVAALLNSRSVGLYGISYRLLEIMLLVGTFYQTSMLPAATAPRSPAEFQAILTAGWTLLFRFGLPLVVLCDVLSGPIVRVAGGETYAPAALSFALLMPAGLVTWINSVSGAGLISARLETVALPINISVLVLNLLGNLVLIPTIGIAGAALMTLVAELIAAVLALSLLRRRVAVRFVILGWRRGIYASIAWGIYAAILIALPMPPEVRLAAGVAPFGIYALVLGWTGRRRTVA